jgi:uncharacterized membrane protein
LLLCNVVSPAGSVSKRDIQNNMQTSDVDGSAANRAVLSNSLEQSTYRWKRERLSLLAYSLQPDTAMLVLAQKTSQVLLHMAVAFGVTYGFTGSLAVGGIAAVVEPVCNVLILPLHDRAWQRLRGRLSKRRGRRTPGSAAQRPSHGHTASSDVSAVPA